MSAYMIFIRDKMLDANQYAQYLQTVAPTLAAYGGEILVLNGANQSLEGAPIDGAVILRFPDMTAARAWYDSPEYAAVKDQRITATEGRAILVESL